MPFIVCQSAIVRSKKTTRIQMFFTVVENHLEISKFPALFFDPVCLQTNVMRKIANDVIISDFEHLLT